jgi:two-component system OmpR family response regulator
MPDATSTFGGSMPDVVATQVLIVEDDEPLAAIVARHLVAHGLPTEVARSAEEAERRLAAGLRPTLVLLDINLPGETGWSLLRGRAYAAAGSPRTVVVSATRIPTSRLREFGVAGYLPKPFAMETLLETVRRFAPLEPADPSATSGSDLVDVEIP